MKVRSAAVALALPRGARGGAEPRARRARASQSPTQEAPPELARLARQVQAGRIEQSIRTLAGFGTRHTLSSQDDPRRGIGAARDWLLGELQSAAARSAGG